MTSPDRTTRAGSDHPRSRRGSIALLIGALALLALPTFGTAQAPRRIVPATPLAAATRALIEGRYDEVEALTDKLDARDPNVVALKARASIARGKYADAENAAASGRDARTNQRSRAGTGPPVRHARTRRGEGDARTYRPDGRHERRSVRARTRGRARCARSAVSRKPTPRIARRRPGCRSIRPSKQRGANCSSTVTTSARRSGRFRWRCRSISAGRRRSSAPPVRSPTRTRRRPARW